MITFLVVLGYKRWTKEKTVFAYPRLRRRELRCMEQRQLPTRQL